MRSLRLLFCCLLAACAGDPDTVIVELSPDLISSLDGTTTVTALVAAEATPLADIAVRASVAYTDRNGTAHVIDDIPGTTDERGVFTAPLTGLTWDGIGMVTVTTDNGIAGTATFTVLDRTPPVIEILPPTTDLRVGPGLPLDVQVRVTDEIGVSEVVIDGQGLINGDRRTVVASGSQDTTLTFRMAVAAGAQAGPTLQLFALATDLSGNIAVADPVTLTVDPAITIATPPGLTGSQLTDGTAQQLVSPRAIAYSTKDNHLYVADVAGTGACNPSCVWRIDATTGTIVGTVHVGQGSIEGVAFDATADNLYLTDRQDRITRLTWNGTAYATPASCTDTAQQQPQDPYHLIVDAILGVVAVDGQDNNVQNVTTCSASAQGQAVCNQDSFDEPRGIAAGPAGELYVSDLANDRVSRVDPTSGNVTAFSGDIDTPYGLEWLGTSAAMAFADSLMVASVGQRVVLSVKGVSELAATYLRNPPVDLTIHAGTMYILTQPFAGARGRIYRVTGF